MYCIYNCIQQYNILVISVLKPRRCSYPMNGNWKRSTWIDVKFSNFTGITPSLMSLDTNQMLSGAPSGDQRICLKTAICQRCIGLHTVLTLDSLTDSKGEIESSSCKMEMSGLLTVSFSNSSGKTQRWALCQFHSGCSHWSHHCWWYRIGRQTGSD